MSVLSCLVGIFLALASATIAALTGLDRERGFYVTMLMVVGSYYSLFAVMGGSSAALMAETLGLVLFAGLAVIGFRTSLWLVVAGLAAHGLFDAIHPHVIDNPGTPLWWPGICMSFDLAAAGCLLWRIKRSGEARTAATG
jgi:hypothetical protein